MAAIRRSPSRATRRHPPEPRRVAVVDVGSATATLSLYRRGRRGAVEEVDAVTRDLGLQRLLDDGEAFDRDAIDATVGALREFSRRARLFGADHVEAIATSAVRDAANGAELVEAVRDATSVDLRIVTGEEEARLAVASAVGALPFTDGLVIDLGGGSLQLARVRRRRAQSVATLPLGALRMQLAFLASDPPSAPELVDLRRHVTTTLGGVPWIADAGDTAVGIGGTLRALAKIHRRERGASRDLHGYPLDDLDVLDALDVLSRLRERDRADVPGLRPTRAGSIVAGLVVTSAVLRASGTDRVVVSARGVRDGCARLALQARPPPSRGGR